MKAIAGVPQHPGRFRRTAELRLSPIKEMELRAARLPGVVSLAQGIPSFDTPEPIRAYVREKLMGGELSRYSLSPGLPNLREAVADALAKDGMLYDPDGEILITCGSIEAIAATLLAVLEPGHEVLIPSPSYTSYAEVVRIAGGVPRFVPLVEEENFDLDTEAFARAVTRRTSVILFCNPNNPTGTVYSRAQIERVAALAEEHDLLIVTDEVYKDFLYNDAECVTPASLMHARDRVVRIFSFSKAYGMTGWRVGFLHSSREVVGEILKVHDALVTCAPVVSQVAALAALELGDEIVRGFRDEFRRRRDRTLGYLDALSHIFDYQKPNASYFVFPRVKDSVPLARDSRRLALEILDRARVALVPGVAFGPTGEAHLRLSYGRRTEDIDEAFSRLADYFHRPRPRAPERHEASPSAEEAVETNRGLRARLRPAAISALAALSRSYLRRVRPRTIGLAGLQGKTVVKRWLREMLEPSLAVRANPRSYNTDIGLPLAILGVELASDRGTDIAAGLLQAAWRGLVATDRPDVLVLEMGLRRAGDADDLLRAVVPDILVLTPLAPSFAADLSFLGTVEREVHCLAAAVAARGGTIFACGEDPRLASALTSLPGVKTLHRESFRARDGGAEIESSLGPLETTLDVVGESSEYALLAGIEVATLLGVDREGIARSLKR